MLFAAAKFRTRMVARTQVAQAEGFARRSAAEARDPRQEEREYQKRKVMSIWYMLAGVRANREN